MVLVVHPNTRNTDEMDLPSKGIWSLIMIKNRISLVTGRSLLRKKKNAFGFC